MRICGSWRHKITNDRIGRVIPLQQALTCRRSYATEVSAASLRFGQPLHETHPHILEAGQLTPGISALEYAQRRTRLAQSLPKGAVAILAASDVKYRSGAVFWPFHQNSNFFYLTGFNEPEAVAVIGKSRDNTDHTFHLFLRPKNEKVEAWEGTRSGLEAAVDVFNADEGNDIAKFESILPDLISDVSEVYSDLPSLATSNTSIFSRILATLKSESKSKEISDLLSSRKAKALNPLLNELRVLKSNDEIALLRRIGQATGRSFQDAMRKEWTSERQLMAFLQWRHISNGCEGNAYVPIIAGGNNALVKHYTRNDDILQNGEMVLVDAGGEIGHYITDITRTWPIGGKFSPAQKDLYNAVLSVQRSCVSLCRADAKISLDKLHSIAQNKLIDNLQCLGFNMSGNTIDLLFPHHLSHYIGLDIHDTPGYSRVTPLKEGMCVTVEPGIHVPDIEDDRFPAAFRGMSVQIEDSIAVGAEHPTILSTEAPKEIDDMEALCKRGRD